MNSNVIPLVPEETLAAFQKETDATEVAEEFTDFNGADFAGEDLSGTDLSGIEAIGANFSHADLSYANLSRAHLDGANFDGADLTGTEFAGADIRGATFHGAYVDGFRRLVGDCPIISIGPIMDLNVTAYNTEHGVYVQAGTFFGTLADFEAALQEGGVFSRMAYVVVLFEEVWAEM